MKTDKKMLFLINPVAGRATLGQSLLDIVDCFVKAGYEIDIHTTQSTKDIASTIEKKGSLVDSVVCCGGDGTLNRTVDAILKLENKPRLGYIPAGTVNDFAHTHSIPRNALAAAKRIAKGKSEPIDIGCFNKRGFVYVAAFGVFTEVSYTTPQEMKNAFGKIAYLVEGTKSIADISPYHIKFEYNGQTVAGEFIYGMISNSSSIGGIELAINKDSSYNDGLMEVTLVKNPKTLADRQRLLNALITQKADSNMLWHFQTKHLSFKAEEHIAWTLDGENGGMCNKADINVLKDAIEIIS